MLCQTFEVGWLGRSSSKRQIREELGSLELCKSPEYDKIKSNETYLWQNAVNVWINLLKRTSEDKVAVLFNLIVQQFHENIYTELLWESTDIENLLQDNFIINNINSFEKEIQVAHLLYHRETVRWCGLAWIFSRVFVTLVLKGGFVDIFLVHCLTHVWEEKLFMLENCFSLLLGHSDVINPSYLLLHLSS